MLFVDLDWVKEVNDTLGHAVGDRVLREVAERLDSVTRAPDTVARFAGDEFAVIVEAAAPADVLMLANRLITVVAEPLKTAVGTRLSASAGVAFAGPDAADPETLLRHADAAMYQAKAHGGNGVVVFDAQLRDELEDRKWLEQALGDAAAQDQLDLVYQPFYALGSDRDADRPVAVEALVRWTHPEKGSIPPSVFIGVAGSAGLICGLGDWILRQACHDVARWQDSAPDGFRVHVNVSPLQLVDPGFLDRLDHWVEVTGAEPGRLAFEITETVILDDSAAVQRARSSA